jgi:hypothetical protein
MRNILGQPKHIRVVMIKVLVFLLFLLVFLASSGGHLDVWDGKGYFFLTENLVLHQSLEVHPDLPSINETKFDIKSYFNWQYGLQNNGQPLPDGTLTPMFIHAAPMLSYFGVPFYVIAKAIDFSAVKFTAYFLNSIILSFVCVVVFAFASEIYQSKRIALVLALIAGVCSFLWPYISSYFQQPLAGLLIISSSYFLFLSSKGTFRYSAILGGLFLGLSILAHTGSLIWIPGIAAIVVYSFRKEKRKIVEFFVGLLPPIALQLYLNVLRFNSLTDFGSSYTIQYQPHAYIEGIYGMFLSPGFGLIVNFPLILLFPIAAYYLWKQNKNFCAIFLYFFVSTWLFFGTWESPIWHGYGAWGPRYMVPVVPIIVITLGSLLQRFSLNYPIKISYSVLASIGFLVNLLGILVWYQAGYGYGWVVYHEENFEYDLRYIPVVLHWKVLTTDFWKNLPSPWYGWEPCIPDNFLYCNFGILPVILVLVAIGYVSFSLLRVLRVDEQKVFKT